MRRIALQRVRRCPALTPIPSQHVGFLVLFSDALKTAGELDAHFAATKELKGPLHGVPISFKDLSESVHKLGALRTVLIHPAVDIKGYDSSMGFSKWANKPAQADADVRLQGIRVPIFLTPSVARPPSS